MNALISFRNPGCMNAASGRKLTLTGQTRLYERSGSVDGTGLSVWKYFL
jgi:hypothetical protein